MLDEAQSLAESSGTVLLLPDIAIERARLAELLGDDAARVRWLRHAHDRLVTMGATPRAEPLARELGGKVRGQTREKD